MQKEYRQWSTRHELTGRLARVLSQQAIVLPITSSQVIAINNYENIKTRSHPSLFQNTYLLPCNGVLKLFPLAVFSCRVALIEQGAVAASTFVARHRQSRYR